METEVKSRDDLAGYESREALIRDHWRRYGGTWDLKRYGPHFNIAVRHRRYPYQEIDISDETPLTPPKQMLDKLTFEFSTGRLHDRPAYRVECEGVILEERPL